MDCFSFDSVQDHLSTLQDLGVRSKTEWAETGKIVGEVVVSFTIETPSLGLGLFDPKCGGFERRVHGQNAIGGSKRLGVDAA